MKYVSTRGTAPELMFDDVLLAGLATDGGLYVPSVWPQLSAADLKAAASEPYTDVAFRVMRPFIDDMPDGDLRQLIEAAYASFRHPDVAPLVELEANFHLLELFHGPTLAFKDVAMQFIGRMFDAVLEKRGQSVTIIGATSGDTGSAAIEACRDRSAIDVVIMHPEGRTSDIQRRQMTTVLADNVHNIAIKGTFDDCQTLLKQMFGDVPFRERMRMSAVNSINWGRVMAQIVYYVQSSCKLSKDGGLVDFSVPTGNFGDIYAGYAAKKMGAPVGRLIVATNQNDILDRFFKTGTYARGAVHATMSPSMDIQIASNFERLVFDLCGRDGQEVSALMAAFSDAGSFSVAQDRLQTARADFSSGAVDEEMTTATIAKAQAAYGQILDPHTAVGIRVAELARDRDRPIVALATAHPAKFPDAVENATGVVPALPEKLADLADREERYDIVENDLAAVEAHIINILAA